MGAHAPEGIHPDFEKVILSEEQKAAFGRNDLAGSDMMRILDLLPDSAEKQLARRKLQEAVFWMNLCVVRNPRCDTPKEPAVPQYNGHCGCAFGEHRVEFVSDESEKFSDAVRRMRNEILDVVACGPGDEFLLVQGTGKTGFGVAIKGRHVRLEFKRDVTGRDIVQAFDKIDWTKANS